MTKNIFLCLFLSLCIGTMFIPIHETNLWWREVLNTGHTLMFFVFSFVIHQLLKNYDLKLLSHYLAVILFSALLGLIIELTQELVGRESSLSDLVRNMLGATAGIFALYVAEMKSMGRRTVSGLISGLAAVSILVISLLPWIQLSLHYIERGAAFPRIMDLDAEWSASFVRYQGGDYPGLAIIEPEPDWSAYESLSFDVWSSSDAKLILGFRIHDGRHDNKPADRFNIKVLVQPGVNTYSISLDDVRQAPLYRELDITDIAGVIFYTKDVDEWSRLKISNFILD